jgi:predicted phage terminase large subunit-like protein
MKNCIPRADRAEVRVPRSLRAIREIERREAVDDLATFVREAWPIVEPAKPHISNWHIRAIAIHLEAVTRGKIKKLLINIPPGHAKSLLVCVLWPAWVWIQPGDGPKWRAMFASYASDLSIRDSLRCRMLIESPWYRSLFGPRWTLLPDQNTKSFFANSELGFRLATSVGGRATGYHADCIVADDPLNVREQHSLAARHEVIRWWDGVMSSRLNDKLKGSYVIIMQRLHTEDLSGHVLEQGGYEHLCLPTEFDPQRRCVTVLGRDPRESPGDLLFPQLFPVEAINQIKREMGAAEYAGQHQQSPSPAGGGIFKTYWWKYWQPKGARLSPVMVHMEHGQTKAIEAVELPDRVDQIIQSWDCSFKDLTDSDYVVGQVWAINGADKFLLDCVRARMDLPKTLQAVRTLSNKWPRAELKLVEDKANGSAVIQMLGREISGLVPVEPEGGKIARAHAVSPQVESGNVYLPHPSHAAWVDSLIQECTEFPKGANDDQVDALTQALHRLANKSRANIRSFQDSWEQGLPR